MVVCDIPVFDDYSRLDGYLASNRVFFMEWDRGWQWGFCDHPRFYAPEGGFTPRAFIEVHCLTIAHPFRFTGQAKQVIHACNPARPTFIAPKFPVFAKELSLSFETQLECFVFFHG
jgi:hypothetical protein